ncbi:MAG: hypothetical protein SCJ94_10140 [Bacillota bacterium]|nr:hypothetical protein [Bacillota bacterium]
MNSMKTFFNTVEKCLVFLDQKKHYGALIIAVLVVGSGLLVYGTGGIKYVYSHSMYLAILLSAALFGLKGGIITGLIGGLILGPYMPVDVTTGEMQLAVNWIFRTAFFMLIGGIVGQAVSVLTTRKRKRQAF